MGQDFNSIADQYDRWYDTPEGSAIFRAECDCLLSLYDGPFDGWVDVGVGTGRFAHTFGIPTGIDPSPNMLALAAARGIVTQEAKCEALPFATESFDGVLMTLTLCFVADALRAVSECRRVLRPGGHFLLGIVPAESDWGRHYMEKASYGHPIYRHARFRKATEVMSLVQDAGFTLCGTAGTLFWQPGQMPGQAPEVRIQGGMEGGFLGLLFTNKARAQ